MGRSLEVGMSMPNHFNAAESSLFATEAVSCGEVAGRTQNYSTPCVTNLEVLSNTVAKEERAVERDEEGGSQTNHETADVMLNVDIANPDALPQAELATVEDASSATNAEASNTECRLGVQACDIGESFCMDGVTVSCPIENESAQAEPMNVIRAEESHTEDDTNQQAYHDSDRAMPSDHLAEHGYHAASRLSCSRDMDPGCKAPLDIICHSRPANLEVHTINSQKEHGPSEVCLGVLDQSSNLLVKIEDGEDSGSHASSNVILGSRGMVLCTMHA